jgi:hypothetical protein
VVHICDTASRKACFAALIAMINLPHSIGLSGNQKSLDWQGQLDA